MRWWVLSALPLLLGACGSSLESRRDAPAARRPEDVVTYEQVPARPHRVVGSVTVESVPWVSRVLLSDVRNALREVAAHKGCDAVRWSPYHVLAPGPEVRSDVTGKYEQTMEVSQDTTGVYAQIIGGRRLNITGGRGECLRWTP
jgi:hypothetical protein